MIDFPFERFGLKVRAVIENDADFILKLRTDLQLARYLSKTESNIDKQISWIKEYKKRQANGKEYYLIFERASCCHSSVVASPLIITPLLPTVFSSAAKLLVITSVFEAAASSAVKQNVSINVHG